MNEFTKNVNEVAEYIHQIAIEKGWWENDRSDGELIALMHSELSEALEALREGNKQSEKIPLFSCVEEEFADCVIRILDACEKRKWNVSGAILAKIQYNRKRSYKHGNKVF